MADDSTPETIFDSTNGGSNPSTPTSVLLVMPNLFQMCQILKSLLMKIIKDDKSVFSLCLMFMELHML